MHELHYLTLTDLAGRIRAREISPVEVVEHLLARIERLDPRLRAFVTVTADAARGSAQQAEAALASGAPVGPLHGVPVGVKDLCDTRGTLTTAGMAIFAGRVPERSATVVERLLDAGAVLLGKLKTTEGAGIVHHPSVAPPVNPWNAARWCGASSSGSGVATAAGLCFGALGSDTAGSIRFPSAANGVVGLKPTFGLVPTDGVFPLAPSFDHVGPMARSVRDVARLLGVLAGPSEHGPRDFERELDAGVQGLVIGLDEDYCTHHVDPDLSSAVLDAARRLESLGAEIRSVRLEGIDDAVLAFGTLFHGEVARVHEPYFLEKRDQYGPHLRDVILVGQGITEREQAEARATRGAFQQQLTSLLAGVDAMIAPPALTAPPPAEIMLHVPTDFRQMAMALRYTTPYDLAGVPALTLPAGFAEGDVPLAVQLVGARDTEARLLRIGRAYEAATAWHERHPALA
jgi:amidase